MLVRINKNIKQDIIKNASININNNLLTKVKLISFFEKKYIFFITIYLLFFSNLKKQYHGIISLVIRCVNKFIHN